MEIFIFVVLILTAGLNVAVVLRLDAFEKELGELRIKNKKLARYHLELANKIKGKYDDIL